MKELSVREIAAVKRQFKNSLPALKKIEAINKKIAALEEEKAIQEAIIDGGETGIMRLTGGYKSIDLISCNFCCCDRYLFYMQLCFAGFKNE